MERSLLSRSSRRTVLRGVGAALTLPIFGNLQAQTAAAYTNPLGIAIADPYVLHAPDGRYYIYGTGGGRDTTAYPTFTSTDLVNWTSVGQTYLRDPKTSWCIGSFWAPEVYSAKGRFYMFYSAQWRNNPTSERENFRIGVAAADQPGGPFRDIRNAPVFDPGYPIIDADVLFDDDGRVYLYYSRCCYKHPVESERAEWARKQGLFTEIEESWIYGVELKADFSGVIGEPAVLIRPPVKLADPHSAWEDMSVITKEANRRWTEAPCSFKHRGRYYLMFSANSVMGENYALGYATAEHPLGPFRKAENNPVVKKNTESGGDVISPAHNCVAMSPDGSEMFCLYGARKKGASGFVRILFMDRMEIRNDGTLLVHGPDSGIAHPMPSSRKR